MQKSRKTTHRVMLTGCMVGGALVLMWESAWATGPSAPIAIEFDDDAVSIGSAYDARAEGHRVAIAPRREGVRGAKLGRRLFRAGKLVDDRDVGDVSWDASQANAGAEGTLGQRTWMEIPGANLEDGYYAEVIRAEATVDGADRPVQVRAYRYYRVTNGIRTRINSRTYSDATAEIDFVRDKRGVLTKVERGYAREVEAEEITHEAVALELQELNNDGPNPDDMSEADED